MLQPAACPSPPTCCGDFRGALCAPTWLLPFPTMRAKLPGEMTKCHRLMDPRECEYTPGPGSADGPAMAVPPDVAPLEIEICLSPGAVQALQCNGNAGGEGVSSSAPHCLRGRVASPHAPRTGPSEPSPPPATSGPLFPTKGKGLLLPPSILGLLRTQPGCSQKLQPAPWRGKADTPGHCPSPEVAAPRRGKPSASRTHMDIRSCWHCQPGLSPTGEGRITYRDVIWLKVCSYPIAAFPHRNPPGWLQSLQEHCCLHPHLYPLLQHCMGSCELSHCISHQSRPA